MIVTLIGIYWMGFFSNSVAYFEIFVIYMIIYIYDYITKVVHSLALAQNTDEDSLGKWRCARFTNSLQSDVLYVDDNIGRHSYSITVPCIKIRNFYDITVTKLWIKRQMRGYKPHCYITSLYTSISVHDGERKFREEHYSHNQFIY